MSPEISEYFLAGKNDGGAFIDESNQSKRVQIISNFTSSNNKQNSLTSDGIVGPLQRSLDGENLF